MNWLRRLLSRLVPHHEPLSPARRKSQRKIIARADDLLERAEKVIHPELGSYRRVRTHR